MSDSAVRWVSGCPSGVMVTAAVALMLLPAQYYVGELAPALEPEGAPASALERALDAPPLDALVTLALAAVALGVYLCEWVQRKAMERRLGKLHGFLEGSVERLRGWDAQQEQLETTLRLVQSATAEYNLLLYLLLRQHPRPNATLPHAFNKATVDDL